MKGASPLSWILRRDPGLLLVNKPAGILSQGDRSGDAELAGILRKSLTSAGEKLDFLAPVHRLDRNTSGLILLATNRETARRLTEDLQEGRIHRTYLAVAKGDTGEEGRLEFRLRKNEGSNEVRVDPQGEEAVTLYQRREFLGNSSLVEVTLLTGRSHQIRVHFAHAGHALLGDKKYAKKPWSEIFSRPALHAARIEYPLGDGSVAEAHAPLPEDMRELLGKLGSRLGASL